MACHACPIHNLQIFGLDHYAMHPSLNNSAYCTCALNFIPTRKKPRSAPVAVLTTEDVRLDAKVNGLDCTSNIGWSRIMAYATPEECVRTYAQLSFAFGPTARTKWNVFFLRKKMVMAYLTPAERLGVFSLVSSEAKVGASSLKRTADFANGQLVLANGSIALDRMKAASIRFPALEDVSVYLWHALSDSKGFRDARRALILAKLCTFTFVTKLVLHYNDIAVVPDAIGKLTNLKELDLSGNKIATLPASIGQLTALKTLTLHNNRLTAVPDSICKLTALRTLCLTYNSIGTLPTTIGRMTELTTLDLYNNKLRGLPGAIGKLTGLKTLTLYNNELTALPDAIEGLANLNYLNLVNNPYIRSEQSAKVKAWLGKYYK